MGHGGDIHDGCCGVSGQNKYVGESSARARILDLAGTNRGAGIYQYGALSGYSVGASSSNGLSARAAGLIRCRACGALHKIDTVDHCRRCGASVTVKRSLSLQRVWAFLIVGVLSYIPANIHPITTTQSLTGSRTDTIVSGIIALYDSGSVFVAGVIFVASICIPVMKFLVIGGLALTLHFNWPMSIHTRHRLHALTEFIGRWSMIDVFVVAVLAALIQLGSILTITPGIGIGSFAVSVIFTMFAASSLDSRLFWGHG